MTAFVESARTTETAVLDVVVPSGEPWSHVVRTGQTLRIVDLEGNQAVDTLFYVAADTSERYSAPETVRVVHSHPMALAQCRKALNGRYELVAASTTSEAARTVAALGDVTVAAIASPLAARSHGLAVLADEISDHPENLTRFGECGPQRGEVAGPDERAGVGDVEIHRSEAGRRAKCVDGEEQFVEVETTDLRLSRDLKYRQQGNCRHQRN